MATINLGNLTFTHKGDYAGGTAYVKNDIVYYATNGNSYIAKTSTTGNAPTSTTHWDLFVAGSSGIWNAGLSLGTAGQSVKVNAAGNALEFGTISSGTYSVHDFQTYSYNSNVSTSAADHTYVDIAGGNYLSFTPTSTNDYFVFRGMCLSYTAHSSCGGAVHVRYGTSTSLGSSSTQLFNRGTHANYSANYSDDYRDLMLVSFLKATSLTPNTTYYAEMAGSSHNQVFQFNHQIGGRSGDAHFLQMMHLKKNS